MNKDSKPAILNHVKRLRFEHDQMTQEDLARRVGVTRQTIITLEANKYVPSLTLAFKIAKTFQSKVDDVFELAN